MHSSKWPVKSVIQRLIRKFETTGSVLYNKRGKVGAKRSARTLANIKTAWEILEATPQMSLNRVAQELDVSYTMVRHIVREDLNVYPYKLQMLQSWTLFLKQRRLTFTQTFQTHLEKQQEVLPLIWFSDEVLFSLSGYVNKQNCRIWSKENPHKYEATELHPQCVTKWAALRSEGLLGPFILMKRWMEMCIEIYWRKKVFQNCGNEKIF